MKKVSRIAGINLLVLAVYTITIHLFFVLTSSSKGGASMGILFTSMLPVAIHVITNIIISLVQFTGKNKELGKAFLLSSILVLIIGFSTCWGSAFLSDVTYKS